MQMEREMSGERVAPVDPRRRRAANRRREPPTPAAEPDRKPPEPFKGGKPPLAAGTTVDAALDVLLRAALSHCLGNRPAVLAGDPEGVHQMRVGLRRLRSTLSTFRPSVAEGELAPLLDEARALFAQLGEVREADVFLLETLTEAEADGLPDRPARATRSAVLACRERSFATLAGHLESPDFDRFVKELTAWIDGRRWRDDGEPVLALRQGMRIEEFLGPRLDRAWRRVLKRARKAEKGSLSDWHQVRIAIKRVRYVGEQLSDVYGDAAARFSKKMQRLQEDLGHLNDLATTDAVIDRAETEAPARLRPAVREARLFLAGWRAGQEKALGRALRKDGEKLRRTPGFW